MIKFKTFRNFQFILLTFQCEGFSFALGSLVSSCYCRKFCKSASLFCPVGPIRDVSCVLLL
jgi:hypothetical protein